MQYHFLIDMSTAVSLSVRPITSLTTHRQCSNGHIYKDTYGWFLYVYFLFDGFVWSCLFWKSYGNTHVYVNRMGKRTAKNNLKTMKKLGKKFQALN